VVGAAAVAGLGGDATHAGGQGTVTPVAGGSTVTPSVATPRAANVVLADNFDDPAKARLLPISPDPAHYQLGYDDGEYVIRKADPNWQQIPSVFVPTSETNATIAVDARLAGDTRNRFVAIACRSSEEGQYRLVVEPARGNFAVYRFDGTRGSVLAPLKPSSAIHRGNDSNHIEFTCSGSRIAARINGTEVASLQDSAHQGGQILIGAGAGEAGPVEGRFDNLVVTRG
jgi:hypothetical protein